MLYAIQVGDGPVKLGTAVDPVARLRVLRTAHHMRLHLRAAWPGGRVDEQALHARFDADRLHGEWFGCTPELIAFVRERAAAMSPPAPGRGHAPRRRCGEAGRIVDRAQAPAARDAPFAPVVVRGAAPSDLGATRRARSRRTATRRRVDRGAVRPRPESLTARRRSSC